MIEFLCLEPGVIESMPIIKASEYEYEWISKYKKFVREKNPIPSTLKCPAIAEITGKGWINRAHQSFTIITNGDLNTFLYNADETKVSYSNCYINAHGGHQMAEFRDMPKATLNTIVKVNTPWMVNIPDGYMLLNIPIPYGDENRFTAAIGTLRGFQPLNVQLYWHCLNDKVVIEKGTPLNQLILVKDDKMEHVLSNGKISMVKPLEKRNNNRNVTVVGVEKI